MLGKGIDPFHVGLGNLDDPAVPLDWFNHDRRDFFGRQVGFKGLQKGLVHPVDKLVVAFTG